MSLQKFRQHALPTTRPGKDVNKVLDSINIDALEEAIRLERGERKKTQPRQGSSETQGMKDTKEQDKSEAKTKTGSVSEKQTAYTCKKVLSKTEEKDEGVDKEEADFFKHIMTIYDRVASAGRQALKLQEISKIDYNPGRAPVSLECQNTFIPHCNLVLATSISCKDDSSDATCTPATYLRPAS
jgi:hypothetical protein